MRQVQRWFGSGGDARLLVAIAIVWSLSMGSAEAKRKASGYRLPPGYTVVEDQSGITDPPAAMGEPDPAPMAVVGSGTVATSHLRMRSQPSTGASVVADLPRNSRVEVLKEAQGWYYVRSNRGRAGWVSGSGLKVEIGSMASKGAPPPDPMMQHPAMDRSPMTMAMADRSNAPSVRGSDRPLPGQPNYVPSSPNVAEPPEPEMPRAHANGQRTNPSDEAVPGQRGVVTGPRVVGKGVAVQASARLLSASPMGEPLHSAGTTVVPIPAQSVTPSMPVSDGAGPETPSATAPAPTSDAPSGLIGTIAKASVPLRQSPNAPGFIGLLSGGSKVTVFGYDGEWAHVRTDSGEEGYVRATDVR